MTVSEWQGTAGAQEDGGENGPPDYSLCGQISTCFFRGFVVKYKELYIQISTRGDMKNGMHDNP